MATRKTPPPPPEPEEPDATHLAQLARENPFRHFTHREARVMFGFGEKFFRSLLGVEGAPVAANKINPEHFRQFLWEKRAVIATLAGGGGDGDE